jgi:hypothetical protein
MRTPLRKRQSHFPLERGFTRRRHKQGWPRNKARQRLVKGESGPESDASERRGALAHSDLSWGFIRAPGCISFVPRKASFALIAGISRYVVAWATSRLPVTTCKTTRVELCVAKQPYNLSSAVYSERCSITSTDRLLLLQEERLLDTSQHHNHV